MTGIAETGGAIEDIAKAVARGECILFLGSGVHAPPPSDSSYSYAEEERPPFGSVLSAQLAEKCKVLEAFPKESVANLQRMSLFFETAKGRKQLIEEINAAVENGKKPSPALYALAELDFPLVITTNYDRLFERALAAAGKEPVVSIYSQTSRRPTTTPLPRPRPTNRSFARSTATSVIPSRSSSPMRTTSSSSCE